jgi:hypothetical protein
MRTSGARSVRASAQTVSDRTNLGTGLRFSLSSHPDVGATDSPFLSHDCHAMSKRRECLHSRRLSCDHGRPAAGLLKDLEG